jgi:predicted nucleotidyltransferase
MERPLTGYEFFRRLAALPFVDAIWLFGSRAQGTARPRSDIDLAILCPRADWRDWDLVERIVEEADTLLRIDCLRWDELQEGDPLRASILRHHEVVFERAPA